MSTLWNKWPIAFSGDTTNRANTNLKTQGAQFQNLVEK